MINEELKYVEKNAHVGDNPTPEEFAGAMEIIRASKLGIDDKHVYMDILMCETLEKLGFQEGIEHFHKQEKWYS